MINTSKLSRLAINEQGFIFDPNNGECYTTNDSGKLIVQGLIEKKDEVRICADLMEKYEVTQQEAAADIRDFIHHLKNYHLI